MKRFIILIIGGLLLITHAFSQGPCNNIKVVSPVAPKPTDPVVTNDCSGFTVQWQDTASQSFVFTATAEDPATNIVIATFVINSLSNSVTIFPDAGSSVSWQVEAIDTIDGRIYYSYPLRSGKDFIIPACRKPVAAAGRSSETLKVSGNLSSKVRIYPNPFQSSLNIEFNDINPAKKLITLFDINGRKISTQRTAQNLTQINLKQLARGNYIIRIQDGNGKLLYSGKVVKE